MGLKIKKVATILLLLVFFGALIYGILALTGFLDDVQDAMNAAIKEVVDFIPTRSPTNKPNEEATQ